MSDLLSFTCDLPGARSARLPAEATATLADGSTVVVHVEFALSEVDYFAGILADRAAATLAWQGYCLDHADWFAAPRGREFLAALERGASA